MTIIEDKWRKGTKKCVGVVVVVERSQISGNKDEKERRLIKRDKKGEREKGRGREYEINL